MNKKRNWYQYFHWQNYWNTRYRFVNSINNTNGILITMKYTYSIHIIYIYKTYFKTKYNLIQNTTLLNITEHNTVQYSTAHPNNITQHTTTHHTTPHRKSLRRSDRPVLGLSGIHRSGGLHEELQSHHGHHTDHRQGGESYTGSQASGRLWGDDCVLHWSCADWERQKT